MSNTRKRLKPTMGLFDNKREALILLKYIMMPDIINALSVLMDNPLLMFQHVRTKSHLGDMMWTSPLKFVVMTGHPGLLAVFKYLADKNHLSAAFDHQQQEVQSQIKRVERRVA